MAGFHAHFRKSFTIIPGLLKWTISKRGVSLNAHAGPLSKSWGTYESETSIDGPGHFGLGWRKTDRRKTSHQAKHHPFSGFFTISLVGLEAVVLAGRTYLHPLAKSCTPGTHPGTMLLVVLGLQVGALLLIWTQFPRLRGFVFFLLMVFSLYVEWKLWGHFVGSHIHCLASSSK